MELVVVKGVVDGPYAQSQWDIGWVGQWEKPTSVLGHKVLEWQPSQHSVVCGNKRASQTKHYLSLGTSAKNMGHHGLEIHKPRVKNLVFTLNFVPIHWPKHLVLCCSLLLLSKLGHVASKFLLLIIIDIGLPFDGLKASNIMGQCKPIYCSNDRLCPLKDLPIDHSLKLSLVPWLNKRNNFLLLYDLGCITCKGLGPPFIN